MVCYQHPNGKSDNLLDLVAFSAYCIFCQFFHLVDHMMLIPYVYVR